MLEDAQKSSDTAMKAKQAAVFAATKKELLSKLLDLAEELRAWAEYDDDQEKTAPANGRAANSADAQFGRAVQRDTHL